MAIGDENVKLEGNKFQEFDLKFQHIFQKQEVHWTKFILNSK